MTTGLWYDQCWSSWQFMYLLWIVHRMLPQREGTVWDVEVSNQKSTVVFYLSCFSIRSVLHILLCHGPFPQAGKGYQLVVAGCERRPHFPCEKMKVHESLWENLCGAKVLHFSQLLIAEFMLITSWMSGPSQTSQLLKRFFQNETVQIRCAQVSVAVCVWLCFTGLYH